MFTRKEILERLEQQNVDMAKNPDRTFQYYHQRGLLPKPRRHPLGKRELVFPERTIDVLKAIREYRKVHKGLDEIKILTAYIREPDVLKNKQQLFENPEFYGEQIRKEIIKILNLEESEFQAWLVFPKEGPHFVMVHVPPEILKVEFTSFDNKNFKEILTAEEALFNHTSWTHMIFL